MNHLKKIPDGYYSLTPYLNLKDASKAIDFYKKAFDAKEQMRMMAPDGKSIIHAELMIGNSRLMVADENKDRNYLSPTTLKGSSGGIYLHVDDADRIFNQAIAEGAKVLNPIKDQFCGDRHGVIEDPFGHRWSIATRIKNLTPEELNRAAREAFGDG